MLAAGTGVSEVAGTLTEDPPPGPARGLKSEPNRRPVGRGAPTTAAPDEVAGDPLTSMAGLPTEEPCAIAPWPTAARRVGS